MRNSLDARRSSPSPFPRTRAISGNFLGPNNKKARKRIKPIDARSPLNNAIPLFQDDRGAPGGCQAVSLKTRGQRSTAVRKKPFTRQRIQTRSENEHRLVVAGYQGGRLFTAPALWLLHSRTQRVPRLVNILAHKSMLSAYGKGRRKVTFADVLFAANDTSSMRSPKWR
ncbi:MAG: hypothetical protein AAB393_09495, partial [Bacteroidota bacterium]